MTPRSVTVLKTKTIIVIVGVNSQTPKPAMAGTVTMKNGTTVTADIFYPSHVKTNALLQITVELSIPNRNGTYASLLLYPFHTVSRTVLLDLVYIILHSSLLEISFRIHSYRNY